MQPRQRMFSVGLLIGVAGMVAYETIMRKNPDDMSAMPAPEAAFVEVAMHARAEWNSGANDLAKSSMPAARAAALCKALPDRIAHNWAGTIASVEPDSFPDYYGNKTVRVIVDLTSHVSVATPAAPLFNLPGTMVEAGSPVYEAAADMKIGTPVVFSGKFFSSGPDCMQEESVTEDGSMSNPEFKISSPRFRLPNRFCIRNDMIRHNYN